MAFKVTDNLFRLTSLFIGAAVTVASINCADVGASNDISLQSPEVSVDWSIVTDDAVEDETPVETDSLAEAHDASLIDDNTFTVTAEDDEEIDELIDESLFTYDGTHRWVCVNIANVREEPSVDSESLGTVEYATELICISYGSNWAKVRLSDGTEGFVLLSLIDEEEIEAPTPTPVPEEEEAVPTPTPTPVSAAPEQSSISETDYSATVYASCALNVRTGPGTDKSLVRVLSAGEAINVVAQTSNGWYRTAEGNYVKSDLCTTEAPAAPEAETAAAADTESAAATEETAAATPVETTSSTTTPTEGSYSDFASYCMQYIGVPYVFGQCSPSGFDCSGFVKWVFANYYGVTLPHDADGISKLGTEVSWDSITCGDVLCHDYNSDGYIDHVSIYIGNGTYIHASDSRRGVITTTYMTNVSTIRRFV